MTEYGNVPSPLATGGAGPTFEQHVSAMFLALLLIRGIPAVFNPNPPKEWVGSAS